MITGVIQARCGSTRLPDKVISELGGTTVLGHIVKQLRASERLQQIVLATSKNPSDDKLATLGANLGLKVYRGDEQKIMNRLLNGAKLGGATIVVRLLGDCPLSDPEMIDEFVAALEADPALDMVTNQNPHSFPDGYDISVMRMASLEKLCARIAATGAPEHLSEFWKPDNGFRIKNITAPENWFARYRMTLDYEKDLTAIRKVVTGLNGGGRVLHLKEVLEYLQKNPDIVAINKEYIA